MITLGGLRRMEIGERLSLKEMESLVGRLTAVSFMVEGENYIWMGLTGP